MLGVSHNAHGSLLCPSELLFTDLGHVLTLFWAISTSHPTPSSQRTNPQSRLPKANRAFDLSVLPCWLMSSHGPKRSSCWRKASGRKSWRKISCRTCGVPLPGFAMFTGAFGRLRVWTLGFGHGWEPPGTAPKHHSKIAGVFGSKSTWRSPWKEPPALSGFKGRLQRQGNKKLMWTCYVRDSKCPPFRH